MDDPEITPAADGPRAPLPGEPPVEGAQWDELHQRWERWDDATQSWTVVGDDPGAPVAPSKENPLPVHLTRELQLAEDLEADDPPPVADVERTPAPDEGPEGAQWNEVLERWERWDPDAEAWVEATD